MKENQLPQEWLKEHGLKNTKQREMLIKLLMEATEPLDADCLLTKMKEMMIDCNLSTIYRNMEKMIQFHLILETKMNQKSYFSIDRQKHGHYIQCLSCKAVVMVEGCPFEQYERFLEQRTGYKMLGHKVELFGLCKDCRLKEQ